MIRLVTIIWIVLGVCHAAAQDVYLQNRRTPFRPVAAAPGGVGTDPTNVAGLWAQWVADDIGLANGAAVSNWTDRISGWTLSMTTNSGWMPYKTNDVWNGHDALYFNDDLLFLSDATFTSYWQGQDMAYTMICVTKRANTNDSNVGLSITTNNLYSLIWFANTGVLRIYEVSGAYSGTATNNLNPHVYIFVDHGQKVSSWIDRYRDQNETAANRGAWNPHTVSYGGYLNTAGNWASVARSHVSECLIYTNEVSGANVTNIVDFLVDKYGITPF